MRSAPRHSARALAGVATLALGFCGLAGCGTQAGLVAEIPPISGNDRSPIALNAGPDELARRSAAERELGHAARAERFARWALALDPEHGGGLVAAARLASDASAAAEGESDKSLAAEVARRHYALAASLDAKIAATIEVERGSQLVAYARSEMVAGRYEQAAALLEELEAKTAKVVGSERRELASLYGELADVWLERELARPAKFAAERANKLGADGETTRVRLLLAEVVAAGPGVPVGVGDQGNSSGLGPLEAKLVSELGRDAERWQAVMRWAVRAGRNETAVWAGLRATASDADRDAAWALLGDAYLALQRTPDALTAWKRAASLLKPADGAALLARVADNVDAVADRAARLELALAAAERAPGSEGGVRGATLAAFTALALDQRPVAIATLEAAARATPKAWQELIMPLVVKGDLEAIAKTLAAARSAGLNDWVANALEASHWQAIASGVATPDLKASANAGIAAAFEAGLASSPGSVGMLELARIAAGLPGAAADAERMGLVRAKGDAYASLYLDAVAVRGDPAKARAILDAGLTRSSAFEAAFLRAHFEFEAGDRSRALAFAESAVRAASPSEVGAAEGFALRLATSAQGAKLIERGRSWLSRAWDPMTLEAPYRVMNLALLLDASRANPELALDVQTAILAEPRARWKFDLEEIRTARFASLAKLGRWEEADERPPASKVGAIRDEWRNERAATEAVMMVVNQDNPERMLRLAARMHPEELERRELMGDIVRQLLARQEPYRAARLVERILTLPDGDGIGTGRLMTLAQDLLDAGRLDLAARALERVASLGERSPKVFITWIRTLLRAGDEAKADEITTRALEARPRRDARALEELAKTLVDEGQLGRALALLSTRSGDSERLEPTTFNLLIELLARSGRTSELLAAANRFIQSDPRSSQRLQSQAATRLIEVGALDVAQTIIDEALTARKRDPQLLTVATTLALARGAPDAEAIADRLLKEAGGAFDVWDRVVGDVRASTRWEAATRLATSGLARFAGAHRLLVLRGRVQLVAGQTDAAMQDFTEALARAPSPKEVLDVVEPLLVRMSQFERLGALESRALALVPGRADATLMLGRALVGTGRVDEATQAFQRVVAETDRAHGLVAGAWFEAGYLGAAVDAWAKVEPSLTDDATSMLENVATALAQRGEAARLDTFVRLYLQALRGTSTPPLLPVALAYRKVGRMDAANDWLERADRETPSPDTMLTSMRWRLELGDRAGALLAAERVVTRRVAQAPPARVAGAIVGPALDPVALELTTLGYPELARDLASHIAGMHGESAATRLVAARAMLVSNDLAGALDMLAVPFEPWRQQRDLIGLLRGVLSELVARGYLDAALSLVTRAIDAGAERELLLAGIRIAARAGDGPQGQRFAQRLTALQPSANGWLTGDVLASERLVNASEEPLTLALQQVSDTPLKFAATALTLAHDNGLDLVLKLIPRIREDKVERALLEGFVASTLPTSDGPRRSAAALLPALGRAAVDPAVSNLAFLMASFVDDAALGAAWQALRGTNVDETKLRLQLAGHLAASQRLGAALSIYDGLLDSEGGDSELALRVFSLALAAGDDARAVRWADKALGKISGSRPPTLRLLFADAAARFGAVVLAQSLISDDQAESPSRPSGEATADSWRKAQVRARLALRDDAGAVAAFRTAIEQRLLLSPDEAVARVEVALMLATTHADSATPRTNMARAWLDEARNLMEPLVREDDAPALALELAFATSRDAASARPLLERTRKHFPGVLQQPALLLHSALVFDDAGLVADVLRTMPPDSRREILLQVVQMRLLSGEGPFASATMTLIEFEATRAAPTDVTAVALEVALARLAGNGAGALQAAESASARAPWSSGLSLVLAQALIDVRKDGARAEQIVRAVMARPSELGLFDAELRFIVPATNWRAWETLAAAQRTRGEAAARQSFERAVALAPESERPRLWLSQPGPASLAACVALERAPWSALCRSRL